MFTGLVSGPGWPHLCLVAYVHRKAGKVLEKHGSQGMGPDQLGQKREVLLQGHDHVEL